MLMAHWVYAALAVSYPLIAESTSCNRRILQHSLYTEPWAYMVQGAVHAVIMQNRVRHLEEKVHNGEVPARETLLSDPETMTRMREAAK